MKVHSFACGRPIAPAPDCPSCSQWPPAPPRPATSVLSSQCPLPHPQAPAGWTSSSAPLRRPPACFSSLHAPCPPPGPAPTRPAERWASLCPILAPAPLRPWPGPLVLLASHFAPLRRKQEEFEAKGSAGILKLALLLIKEEKPRRAEGMPSRTRGQHPEEAAGGEGGARDTGSPGGKGPGTPQVEAGAQQQTRASPTCSSQHLGSTGWGGRMHG